MGGRKVLILELAIIAAVTVVLTMAMVEADMFELFYEFSRTHEDWELDEIALGIPVLTMVLLVFAIHKVLELRKEVELRVRAEKRAQQAETKTRDLRDMKEEFMSIMSHELRTPLNSIVGTLQYLDMCALEGEQKQMVGSALASGRNMNALISDIMDFSRLGHSLPGDETKVFSPGELIGAVHYSLAPLALEKGLDMPVPDTSALPEMVQGFEGPMRQILLNVMGNAIKFTDSGRVELTAGMRPGSPRGTMTLSVKDTGPGIPPEKKDHIFEPFTQLDGSHTRQKGGIGLGLSLVKRLVGLYGGSVRVDSDPGGGSRFTVELPATPYLRRD